MFELIGLAVFGLIVGVIAKLIMPGRDPGGILMTALLGMAGSLLGTWIGRSFFGYRPGERAGWILSILGAIAILALYRVFAGRSRN
jgi:uncharacterized membrane protein YeaQ/YmgE (transglycosylase-associated protein family)